MTPLPYFDVMTPLGPALCIGLGGSNDNPEWVCFIKRTGEPWFFGNKHVRLYPYITSGIQNSPFSHLTPALEKQMKRYRDAGWL